MANYLPVDEMVKDADALAKSSGGNLKPIQVDMICDCISHVRALAAEYLRLRGELATERALVAGSTAKHKAEIQELRDRIATQVPALQQCLQERDAEVERLKDKLAAVATEEWDRISRKRDDARAEVRNWRCIVSSVVRNCEHIDDTGPREEPGPMCGETWGKVAYICGVGSTTAIELCREFGVEPHYDCGIDARREAGD